MQSFPPNTAAGPAVRSQSQQARDWLKTLWPASYKGVPFFVEHDDERGSRRIVEHEMPMRDDPFLEDLGEGVRRYKVDAYVASDAADADAAAVIAICAMRGAGVLVLPAHGPLTVRCLDFGRARAKDKHGYIGLSLEFTREGASSALASIGSLANLVFVQADTTALAIANAFMSAVQVTLQPDYVVSALTDRLQDGAAVLESVRTSQPVVPAASAAQRTAIQTLFNDIPTLVESPATIATVPTSFVAIARGLADGMNPATAVSAFEAIVTDPSVSQLSTTTTIYPTQSKRAATMNADAAYQLIRLAAITAYAEAVAQMTFADRPSAVTVRANVVEFFEQQTDDLPAGDIALVHAINALRNTVVTYLSRAIIDLAPVVEVEVNLSRPSLFWAWRLYADPTRSTDLVDRNRLSHPSFFPLTFEALAK
ncbi:MAG: DNA circularization N-terminal domain-containing protein [Bradyrhizobium sp.]